MNDARFGRLCRARRLRLRLRQADVAEQAGTSQSTVSAVEVGRGAEVSLPLLRRIGRVVGMEVELDPRLPPGEAARLLDAGHARIVELVAATLTAAGWQVLVEYTFSVYGERGSVDVIGWHEPSRTLAIIEVKTTIVDVQDLLAAHDRKMRLVPRLLATERGWRAAGTARLLVLPRSTANRNAIARHAASLRAAYSDAGFRSRSWTANPTATAAIWLLARPDAVEPNTRRATPATPACRRRSCSARASRVRP